MWGYRSPSSWCRRCDNLKFCSSHVLDTSVCVDLYWGRITPVVLDLPLEFVIPDLVAEELSKPSDLAAAFRRVRIGKLVGAQIGRVYALKQEDRCRRLTAMDLPAFVLAHELGATLLTNDDDLRRLASSEGVDCHGV